MSSPRRLFSDPAPTDFGGHLLRCTGEDWQAACAAQWRAALAGVHEPFLTLDLTTIDFITLFEWTTTAALLLRTLASRRRDAEAMIDLIGEDRADDLLPPKLFLGQVASPHPRSHQVNFSERTYRLLGFLEALGTSVVLNSSSSPHRVFYPYVKPEDAGLRAFYAHRADRHTVLHPLMRISGQQDVAPFVDSPTVQRWRTQMNADFAMSPLFVSEELWRVVCRELAGNIVEHSGSDGLIAVRVVEARGADVPQWFRATNEWLPQAVLPAFHTGALEVVVADAGVGIIQTLGEVYAIHHGAPERPHDVLCYAFDELGTSKPRDERWATDTHALSIILRLVEKYGGALRLRSSGAYVTYCSLGGLFKKRRATRGVEPTFAGACAAIPGTQLQVILPLFPDDKNWPLGRRESIFLQALPTGFVPNPRQPKGHLVPLVERLAMPGPALSEAQRMTFRSRCEGLMRTLLSGRAHAEPLVFDFSEVQWPPEQLEWALNLFQNAVAHGRPTLLVELEPQLARGLKGREELYTRSARGADDEQDLILRRFKVPVLALDRDGRKYVFGAIDKYEDALLATLKQPWRLPDLAKAYSLETKVLQIYLNAASSLVAKNNKGLWSCVWSETALAIEASRLITRHFDDVAQRCAAWLGGRDNSTGEKFYLPWLAEWRSDFLEVSRIIARGRYADEAAQRLVYRLGLHLEAHGHGLAEVSVLAAMTTPGLLLASALHRWWPTVPAPVVADIGHYVMVNGSRQPLPRLTAKGLVVIVQDVLDTGRVTALLARLLADADATLVGVVALASLGNVPSTMATRAGDWTKSGGLSRHALVTVPRPPTIPAPSPPTNGCFRIEPRSLRAQPYLAALAAQPGESLLRRYVATLVERTPPLLGYGHFAYGDRHYVLTLNVRLLLQGDLGATFAAWLSDVCAGDPARSQAPWESPEGYALKGDVSAVLMPLHSQIHYLWPRIDVDLAQRGRRQVVWFLEASLHPSTTPQVVIPEQVRSALANAKSSGKPLRIMVLDDAIATASTLEAVLAELLRPATPEPAATGGAPPAIEWIRYVAVVNQLPSSKHWMLHNMGSLGPARIPVVVDECAPLSGLPVYNTRTCPTCIERRRLAPTIARAEALGFEAAASWAQARAEALTPIALDGCHDTAAATPLPIPIRPVGNLDPIAPEGFTYSAGAAWRALDLLSRDHPPNALIREAIAQTTEGSPSVDAEREKYRWAIWQWGFHNWPRLEANAATDQFLSAIWRECEIGSGLVEPCFEALAFLLEAEEVRRFLGRALEWLASQEEVAREGTREESSLNVLDRGLNVLLAAAPVRSLREDIDIPDRGPLGTFLESLAKAQTPDRLSRVRLLRRRVSRPGRVADPRWALETVIEALWRGRSPRSPVGSHRLLPRLVWDVLTSYGQDDTARYLLRSSLGLFLAALDDLEPYSAGRESAKAVRDAGLAVLSWLRTAKFAADEVMIPALCDLRDLLAPESGLRTDLAEAFHADLGTIARAVSQREQDRHAATVKPLHIDLAVEMKAWRVLAPVAILLNTIENVALDPARVSPEPRDAARLEFRPVGNDNVEIAIFTGFADPDETKRRLTRHALADFYHLRHFGADVTGPSPSGDDRLRTLFCIRVLRGFDDGEI